jgi:hypothetical protein
MRGFLSFVPHLHATQSRTAHLYAARFGTLTAFAGACSTDEIPFELCQAAEHGQHEPPVRGRRVGPCISYNPVNLC